jgi:hypothetical protein
MATWGDVAVLARYPKRMHAQRRGTRVFACAQLGRRRAAVPASCGQLAQDCRAVIVTGYDSYFHRWVTHVARTLADRL